MQDGSKKAIIAAFVANLGVAIATGAAVASTLRTHADTRRLTAS